MQKYYAVYKGKKRGIFDSWDECKQSTDGYSGAIYKKFNNMIDALYFVKHGAIKGQINKNIFNEQIYSKPLKNLEKWTDIEEQQLLGELKNKKTIIEISEIHQRSIYSIQYRIKRIADILVLQGKTNDSTKWIDSLFEKSRIER